jgi:hypothetical protein
MFSFYRKKWKTRGSLGCVAGDEVTLELDRTRQTQVTSAREASNSGDNRPFSAC